MVHPKIFQAPTVTSLPVINSSKSTRPCFGSNISKAASKISRFAIRYVSCDEPPITGFRNIQQLHLYKLDQVSATLHKDSLKYSVLG